MYADSELTIELMKTIKDYIKGQISRMCQRFTIYLSSYTKGACLLGLYKIGVRSHSATGLQYRGCSEHS